MSAPELAATRSGADPTGLPLDAPVSPAARCVAIVSGKGGVGKTNLAANLAVAASGLGQRVLLVDGDLGLANIDVLLGLVPGRGVADVVAGQCSIEEALIEGPRGVSILSAASGRFDLAALAPPDLQALLRRIRRTAAAFDLILMDAGAGVGPSVVGLASICNPVLVVTNSEPTALADAYATLKVLNQNDASQRFELLVNGASNENDARRTHRQLARVAERFLSRPVGYAGFLPSDPRLVDAVARQRAVVEAYPSARSSKKLIELAAALVQRVGGSQPEV